MRFAKSFPLILAALLLAGCSNSSDSSDSANKASDEELKATTMNSLIARGCDKYLQADSKGALADFAALAKLDSTYKEVEIATEDIVNTMKGVKTLNEINNLAEEDRGRVFDSILVVENLCAGVDAP